MKQLLIILLLCSNTIIYAQGDKASYSLWIKKADSLYKAKDYKASAQAYSKGFSFFDGKAYPNDRYNAACSYSLASEKDSAFYHLKRIVDKSMNYAYSNYDHMQKDKDLASLHKDKRWEKLINKVETHKIEVEKNLDHELKALLDSVYEEDQGIRHRIDEMFKKYDRESEEIKAFYKEWRRIDSANEVIVTKVLDERGWLGADVVGQKGNSTLFLVIQHAPIETQQKYLPMMRQAVKDGKARGSSLALLEDRVLLRTGHKQIYGSQIAVNRENGKHYVMPLEDPQNVDDRRKSVGLGPLQDYVQRWGLNWDPMEYEKVLPKYEEILNRQQEKQGH